MSFSKDTGARLWLFVVVLFAQFLLSCQLSFLEPTGDLDLAIQTMDLTAGNEGRFLLPDTTEVLIKIRYGTSTGQVLQSARFPVTTETRADGSTRGLAQGRFSGLPLDTDLWVDVIVEGVSEPIAKGGSPIRLGSASPEALVAIDMMPLPAHPHLTVLTLETSPSPVTITAGAYHIFQVDGIQPGTVDVQHSLFASSDVGLYFFEATGAEMDAAAITVKDSGTRYSLDVQGPSLWFLVYNRGASDISLEPWTTQATTATGDSVAVTLDILNLADPSITWAGTEGFLSRSGRGVLPTSMTVSVSSGATLSGHRWLLDGDEVRNALTVDAGTAIVNAAEASDILYLGIHTLTLIVQDSDGWEYSYEIWFTVEE